ncbi:MAG: hypothetical protein WC648_03875 [Candidatus Paceibacterota bacterium]|jgi:hypothetical protein
MDDEIISKPVPPKNEVDSSTDPDMDPPSEKVFDITPDFNISQIDDSANIDAPTQIPEIKVVQSNITSSIPNSTITPPQNTITTNIPPAPISPPTPVKLDAHFIKPPINVLETVPTPPTVPINQATPPSVPVSPVGNKPSTEPANPPTKTLGATPNMTNKTPYPLPTESQNSDIKSIRTFESDVAEIMSRRKPSVTSIAIAESEKKTGEQNIATKKIDPPQKHFNSKFLLLIVSVIMVGGGVIGAYYLYSISPLAPVPVTSIMPVSELGQSLISSDFTSKISIDGLNPSTLTSRIRNEIEQSQAPETIKEIIITTTADEKTMRLNGPDMLEFMNIDVPDNIKRSLDKDWMLGIYTSRSGDKKTFVVVTNNFFQNTFAGMLAWEQYMPDSLKQYLFSSAISNQNQDNNSSTTTNETEVTENSPNFSMRGKFIDRIFSNRDIREYITEDDRILFLYSFLDSTRLLITSDEETLAEVLKRLEK